MGRGGLRKSQVPPTSTSSQNSHEPCRERRLINMFRILCCMIIITYMMYNIILYYV